MEYILFFSVLFLFVFFVIFLSIFFQDDVLDCSELIMSVCGCRNKYIYILLKEKKKDHFNKQSKTTQNNSYIIFAPL